METSQLNVNYVVKDKNDTALLILLQKIKYDKKENTPIIRVHLIHWMKITLRIVIFITGNRRYSNGITITIHKFDCYIWKACKRWCIRKIYSFGNISILKPIIYTKE